LFFWSLIIVAFPMSLSIGIWLILRPFFMKWYGASRWVPVCELKNNNSRLYPSSFRLDQEMNWGLGEPGKLGIDSDIDSVRSISFTPKDLDSD
jgi:hypothetical protein